MPGREVRAYPALLSTEATALAWARAGAPAGAVVAAGYQLSPRGRAGLPWQLDHERDLVFSLVLRPLLAPQREGWVYTVATAGLADALGADTTIEWPDEVRRGGARVGAVGVQIGLGPRRVDWAVATVCVLGASRPRASLVARVANAIAASFGRPAAKLLADCRGRCQTLGRSVRARVAPLGSREPDVSGRAAGLIQDGGLVIETPDGRRIVVRPQNLLRLEEPS